MRQRADKFLLALENAVTRAPGLQSHALLLRGIYHQRASPSKARKLLERYVDK